MFGSLEHHVFEKMGEAAAAARFKTKSNVVVDTYGCYRRGAIGRDDDAQSVFELRSFQRNMQLVQCRSFVYAVGPRLGVDAIDSRAAKKSDSAAALFDSRQRLLELFPFIAAAIRQD